MRSNIKVENLIELRKILTLTKKLKRLGMFEKLFFLKFNLNFVTAKFDTIFLGINSHYTCNLESVNQLQV